MSLSKKHYEAIAKIFAQQANNMFPDGSEDMWRCLRNDIAEYFARDNDKFNYQRFINACEEQK